MKLETRQKVLIPIIIIMFIFVGWQVYNIFFAGPGAISPPPASIQTSQPTAKPTAASPAQTDKANSAKPQQPPVQKTISGITADQSAAYLSLMKEYQKLEAQRMLLQEKMAIAETKRKIAQLQAKLGPTPNEGTAVKGSSLPPYKLAYLDHQGSHWSATLSDRNNVFHEVTSGSSLADGSKVLAVNSRGVVIKKGRQTIRLTFAGPAPFHVHAIRVTAKPKPKPKSKLKPKPITLEPGPVIVRPHPKPKKIRSVKAAPAPVKQQIKPLKPKPPVITRTRPKPKPVIKKKVITAKPLTPNYKVRSVKVAPAPVKHQVEPLKPNYKLRTVVKKSPVKTKPKKKVIIHKKRTSNANAPVRFSPYK